MSIRDDHALAGDLATEAGGKLLRLRAKLSFDDAKALKGAGDQSSRDFLVESLEQLRPSDHILSEEGERTERGASFRQPGLDRRPARRHS